MRVLILEDDLVVGLDIAEELSDDGYEIAGPVSNISDAMKLIESADIDFAVLDANIKGELPRRLARRCRNRAIPFVYVSGHDANYIRSRLPDAPLIAKPFKMKTLKSFLPPLAGPRRIAAPA